MAGLARWLRVLLGAHVAVAAWNVAQLVRVRSALEAIRDGRGSIAEFDHLVDRTAVGALASVVLLVVTGILFAAWLQRAYANVDPLKGRRRYRTGWAWFGWVVPIWNLFRPKQIVNDIWAATEGAVLHREPMGSALTTVWWSAFLVAGVIGRAVPDDFDLDAASAAMTVAIAGEVALAAAAVLAAHVVTTIGRRQRARLVLLAGGEAITPSAPPRLVLVGSLAATALVVAIGGAVGASRDVEVASTGSPQVGDATHSTELEVGTCVAARSITIGADIRNVPTVPCDRPHGYEVFSEHEVRGVEFPGSSALGELAERHCYAAFAAHTGSSILDFGDQFDVVFLEPTPAGWRFGDRVITCLAEVPRTTSVALVDIDVDEVAGGSGPRSVFTLKPGDCLPPDADLQQGTVPVMSCDAAHGFEVFHEVRYAGSTTYPGEDALHEFGSDACVRHLDAFDDPRFDSLTVWPLAPTPESWDLADRAVTCVAELPEPTRGRVVPTA